MLNARGIVAEISLGCFTCFTFFLQMLQLQTGRTFLERCFVGFVSFFLGVLFGWLVVVSKAFSHAVLEHSLLLSMHRTSRFNE